MKSIDSDIKNHKIKNIYLLYPNSKKSPMRKPQKPIFPAAIMSGTAECLSGKQV